eukprot:jgi/Undpi1/11989/HiC_scaffold_4.g01688.m1
MVSFTGAPTAAHINGGSTSPSSEGGESAESDVGEQPEDDVGKEEDDSGEGDNESNASDVDVEPFSLVYEGCFHDKRLFPDLSTGTQFFEDLTAYKCGEWCMARGDTAMGLKNGRRCTCGIEFGGSKHPRVSEDECHLACAGDVDETCGAWSKSSVYRIVPQGSSLEHLSRGTLGSSSYVGEHEDRIGHQGRGLLAGSRIKWPRYGDLNSVPVYYNDVETARNSYLKGSHNVSEVKGNMSEVGGWVEHGDVGMEYLGCFRDHPGHLREFNGAGGRHEGGEEATMKDREHLEEENTVYVFPRSLTPKVCKSRCLAMGMAYFGLQYGRECRCGDHPPYHAPAANCVSPCAGDRTSVCGGAWANTVYRIEGVGVESNGSSTGDVYKLDSANQGELLESASSFRYLGCYHDAGSRCMPPTSTSRATAAATATVFCFAAKTSQDLNGTISVSVEQRPELCGVFCKSLLYPYFGVSWSRECYCGTSFGSLGRSCDYPCAGWPGVTCGGAWANSVYATAEVVPTRAPPQLPPLTAPEPPTTTASPTAAPTQTPAVGEDSPTGERHQENRAPIQDSAREGDNLGIEGEQENNPTATNSTTISAQPHAGAVGANAPDGSGSTKNQGAPVPTDPPSPSRRRLRRHLLSPSTVKPAGRSHGTNTANVADVNYPSMKSKGVRLDADNVAVAGVSRGAVNYRDNLPPLWDPLDGDEVNDNDEVSTLLEANPVVFNPPPDVSAPLEASKVSSPGEATEGSNPDGTASREDGAEGVGGGSGSPVSRDTGDTVAGARFRFDGGGGDDVFGTSGASVNETSAEQHESLPIEVFHPLKGEQLTTDTVATVTWKPRDDTLSVEGNTTVGGIDLWLVAAGGEEVLVAQDIDASCPEYEERVCQYSFLVPSPLGQEESMPAGADSILQLRSSSDSAVLGCSDHFIVMAKTTFTFLTPNRDSIPVRGGILDISWLSTGIRKNLWISLHDAETGRVAATVGVGGNMGYMQWVIPRTVREGVYYLVISPLNGSRRLEKTEASELFRLASPSEASMPDLAFVAPVLNEHVHPGETFSVAWTSPDIERVKLTLQNEWKWGVETLLMEGENTNEFTWQVAPFEPGAGYYLQVENADTAGEAPQGIVVIGGIGEAEFSFTEGAVRTRPFTITQAQPQVVLGDIFKGQSGDVWAKGMALEIEVENAATDEDGKPLPVKLELMRGNTPVWTVPGSPASGPIFETKMADFEPEDGMYHLRATSMLHHQAFDISREFEVTSYIPAEWGSVAASLTLETQLNDDVLEPGKSYEIRWSSWFVGKITVQLRRHESNATDEGAVVLEGGSTFPNKGSYWLTVPFVSEQGIEEWCPARSSDSAYGHNVDSDPTSEEGTVEQDIDTLSESEGDDCCFTLVVADAHDTELVDESGVFCVATTTAAAAAAPTTSLGEGGGEDDGGQSGELRSRNITLSVIKAPELEWEKGMVQEIRWTSEGLTSPVTVSVVGPASVVNNSVVENISTDNNSAGNNSVGGNSTLEQEPGRGIEALTPGNNSSTEQESDQGRDAHITPPEPALLVADNKRLTLSSGLPTAGALKATLGSGETSLPPGDGYMIEVSDASGTVKAFSPAFQLLDPPGVTISRANHNMTVDKGDLVRIEWKFKSKPFPVRVQLFQGSPESITLGMSECVPFKGADGSWEVGCVQDPKSPLYRQCATETDEESAAAHTDYCLEPALLMKVTSVLDPYVYSESETFSVGYPSTLISFRTSGLSYEEAIRENGTVLVHLIESALLVGEGRLELWALNGDPYPMPKNDTEDSGEEEAQQQEGGEEGESKKAEIADGPEVPTLEITLKVSPTTSWRQRSPMGMVDLLGFLCENSLLPLELGTVDCESIMIKDEYSSYYDAEYSRRTCRKRAHRRRGLYYRGPERKGSGSARYRHLSGYNSDTLSVEDEDCYGQVQSPDEFDDVGFGAKDHLRGTDARHNAGFREAASTIVARVLSGTRFVLIFF